MTAELDKADPIRAGAIVTLRMPWTSVYRKAVVLELETPSMMLVMMALTSARRRVPTADVVEVHS